jgi:hypothetical protein
MFLTHDQIKLLCPLAVQATKLAGLISVGVNLLILLPKQHEGDSFAAQFPVDIGPIRLRTAMWGADLWPWKQAVALIDCCRHFRAEASSVRLGGSDANTR